MREEAGVVEDDQSDVRRVREFVALGELDVREVNLAARGGDGAPGTAPDQSGSSGTSGIPGSFGSSGQFVSNAGNGTCI